MAQQNNSINDYSAPGKAPAGAPVSIMPPGYNGTYPGPYNAPAMPGSTGAAIYGNPLFYTPEQRLAIGGEWASRGVSDRVESYVVPGLEPFVIDMQPQPDMQAQEQEQQQQQQQQQKYGENSSSSMLTSEKGEKTEGPVEPYG